MKKPCLNLVVNGMTLILSSDDMGAERVKEQHRVIHSAVLDAVSHGIFPKGEQRP